MHSAVKFGPVLALALVLTGCAAFDVMTAPINATAGLIQALIPGGGGKADQSEPEDTAPHETVVGTVRFSYEGFVLIYSPTSTNLPPGTALTTIDKQGISQAVELKMSAEKKGAFLVADIVSGSPRAGHVVVTKRGGISQPVQREEYQHLD